jgi:predicted dehydrogenase
LNLEQNWIMVTAAFKSYSSTLIEKRNLMTTKVGIIGAGGMVRYHIAGFKAGGAEVAAISDVSKEAATAAAKKFDIPAVADSVEALLADPSIDAISIIVPNKFHAPLSSAALNAGKHVFCEKPPGLNAAEVQTIIDAADAAGKTLMYNFNNRARPEAYAMKAAIDAGEVGAINSAQAKWVRRTGIPGFGGWFTNKSLSGGGPLIGGVVVCVRCRGCSDEDNSTSITGEASAASVCVSSEGDDDDDDAAFAAMRSGRCRRRRPEPAAAAARTPRTEDGTRRRTRCASTTPPRW